MFGIAVPSLMKELTGTIAEFPSERVSPQETEDGAEVVGMDELAARRRLKTS